METPIAEQTQPFGGYYYSNPLAANQVDPRQASMNPASDRKKTLGGGIMCVRFALCWCLLVVLLAPRGAPAADPVSLCLEQLTHLSWCDLEQLYRQAAPGTIPAGYLSGRTIYCPCAPLTPTRSKVSQLVWHGKHFCPCDGTLINQWCLGKQAVRARVCYGESWLDGKPSIVMDYRGMSHVWGDVRDEIREVAPGLYLGLMYRCKSGQPRMKLFFALQACSCPP